MENKDLKCHNMCFLLKREKYIRNKIQCKLNTSKNKKHINTQEREVH